jgi:O-antigen biosynthesis protein
MRSKLRVLPSLFLLLPLDLIVSFGLLLAVAAGIVQRGLNAIKRAIPLLGKEGNSAKNVVAGFSSRCTIVIVSWDGKHLLAECLPSVIEAIRHDGGNHKILVVDNGSTDGSVVFIHENFPTVEILALDANYGFTGGNNRGVARVETDLVVFLNNDMVADPAFLGPLLQPFKDPSVFAVASQVFFADPARRREETGKTRGRFERGFFELWHDEVGADDQSAQTVPVFWAGGGSCAIDRKKYLAIGGFDPLYHPFYVEDTDISYQAWKRGWKCLFAPESRVVHKHRGTSKTKFGNAFVDNTIRKNLYLFVWKNVTDVSMTLEHAINLPRIHGRAMVHANPASEIRAFRRAFRQLPEALRKRLANLSHYSISDREVLLRSQKR